eukprot:TRINITY_DN10925_c0_g1_i3.p1 TRINITY_DN10925_c0_g1~~TRINITY_DN10925_c0_g1_i3.p1  ORF type:complete len:162 (-),score=0.36 TRINITY_DN10925_c0_g1_i3:745-1230(-)
MKVNDGGTHSKEDVNTKKKDIETEHHKTNVITLGTVTSMSRTTADTTTITSTMNLMQTLPEGTQPQRSDELSSFYSMRPDDVDEPRMRGVITAASFGDNQAPSGQGIQENKEVIYLVRVSPPRQPEIEMNFSECETRVTADPSVDYQDLSGQRQPQILRQP